MVSARPAHQVVDDAELREHAQRAGERGWTVFPCVPGGKRPARRHWQRLASSDPVEIDAMWTDTDYNVAVACGNATVLPGDVIVGDDDGVIVIPRDLVEDVVDGAEAKEIQDAWVAERVAEGHPVDGLFPPVGRWKDEYESWLASRDQPSTGSGENQ